MSIESKLPAELQKQRAALFGELAKIATASAALAADRVAFKELPAAALTPQSRQNAAAFGDRELVLIQAEMRTIDALGEIHPQYVAALAALQDQAYHAHAAAIADIQKRLLALGYIDPKDDPMSPCRMLPLMWLNHPAVRRAADDLTAIQNASRAFPWLDRRNQLEVALSALKSKLAA